jgi:hypothetical protein
MLRTYGMTVPRRRPSDLNRRDRGRACRHLVKGPHGHHGARWTVRGTEAVLRLSALRASGDFDEYGRFQEQQELQLNHDMACAGSIPATRIRQPETGTFNPPEGEGPP